MHHVIVTELHIRQRHVGIDVSIDDEKRVSTQPGQRPVNTTTGFEDVVAFLAVNNVEPVFFPGTDAFGDLLTQPAQVDNNRFDAALGE